MNKRTRFLVIMSFILNVLNVHSQESNIKKVESIVMNYQKCLDYGLDMKGCSDKYYFFCDKLLNEIYQIIRGKLSVNEKAKLKNDQLKWLKKRDLYFLKAINIAKEEGEGLPKEDLQMIFVDKKGDFVKERVIYLIKKYKI